MPLMPRPNDKISKIAEKIIGKPFKTYKRKKKSRVDQKQPVVVEPKDMI